MMKKEIKRFGLTLAVVLLLIGALNFWRGHLTTFKWLVYAGIFFFASALFIPALLRPFFFIFTKVTYAISWFNTRLLLIIIYYALFMPIDFFMKLFGKDPLDVRIKKNLDTYWVKKEDSVDDITRYEKQF